MKTLYTPGPWKVVGKIHNDLDVYGVVDSTGGLLAEVPAIDKTDQANARLMASAPELLSIVKAIAEQFSEGADKVYRDALSPHSDDVTLGQWVNEIIASAEDKKS